jgi:hypothetical protein
MNHLYHEEYKKVFSLYTHEGINISPAIQETCIKNIKSTIHEALDHLETETESEISQKTKNFSVDKVILGDIHGELRLAIQNLYLAGIIDKFGRLRPDNKKTLIQLGDVVDREGLHPFESMIYLRALQQEAKKQGQEIHLLFGNHEKFSFTYEDWWNENHLLDDKGNKTIMRPLIQKILIEDVKKERVKLSYAPDDTKFFCFHGRATKETIKRLLADMRKDDIYRKKMDATPETKTYFQKLEQDMDAPQPTPKIRAMDLYKNMEKCGITIEDCSHWMNLSLKKMIQKPEILATSFLTGENQGVYCRNKKSPHSPLIPESKPGEESKYDVKPIQIGGHTPTTTREMARRAKGYGFGILQDRTSIFADADLVKGYQAFVGIHSKTGEVLAFEIRDQERMIQDTKTSNHSKEPLLYLKDKLNFIQIRSLPGIQVKKENHGLSSPPIKK